MQSKIDQLIQELKSEDDLKRKVAAKALGEIKDKRATFPLIGNLKSRNDYVRDFTTKALCSLNDINAIAPLINLAKVSDRYTRMDIACILGSIKGTHNFLLSIFKA